jgi:hypothetical protein
MEEHLIRIDMKSEPAVKAAVEKAEKLNCESSYTNLKITFGVLGLLCVSALTFFLLVHYL